MKNIGTWNLLDWSTSLRLIEKSQSRARNLKILLLPAWLFLFAWLFPFCSNHEARPLEQCGSPLEREGETKGGEQAQPGRVHLKRVPNRKEENIREIFRENEWRFEYRSEYSLQQPPTTSTYKSKPLQLAALAAQPTAGVFGVDANLYHCQSHSDWLCRAIPWFDWQDSRVPYHPNTSRGCVWACVCIHKWRKWKSSPFRFGLQCYFTLVGGTRFISYFF